MLGDSAWHFAEGRGTALGMRWWRWPSGVKILIYFRDARANCPQSFLSLYCMDFFASLVPCVLHNIMKIYSCSPLHAVKRQCHTHTPTVFNPASRPDTPRYIRVFLMAVSPRNARGGQWRAAEPAFWSIARRSSEEHRTRSRRATSVSRPRLIRPTSGLPQC